MGILIIIIMVCLRRSLAGLLGVGLLLSYCQLVLAFSVLGACKRVGLLLQALISVRGVLGLATAILKVRLNAIFLLNEVGFC